MDNTSERNHDTDWHESNTGIERGIEAGAIIRSTGRTEISTVDIPSTPDGVKPRDWVLWHCYKEVQEWMIENRNPSGVAACKGTGWSYNTWRDANRSLFALGRWAEVSREVESAAVAFLNSRMMPIMQTLTKRAEDEKDPQGVQAAKVVLQKVQEYTERIEEAAGGGTSVVMSSAALLDLDNKVSKATIRQSRKKKGVTESVEIEIEP